MHWDPAQYGRYGDERGRPFVDLVARVGAPAPRRVVDLGCGSGALTGLLASRWPAASVEGLDSSPEMIASAPAGRVAFRVEDVRSWIPGPDVDVVVSNAVLQWVPGHLELLAGWAAALPSGGWLAVQVPGNFDSPSHTLMRSLAASPRWAPLLDGVLRHEDAVFAPSEYATVLADAGLVVDAWETTYLHVLSGPDPVLEWVRGPGLRPVLAALASADSQSGSASTADPSGAASTTDPSSSVSAADPSSAASTTDPSAIGAAGGLQAEFETAYAAALRTAYPPGPHGTYFPFRRIFAVAHRP